MTTETVIKMKPDYQNIKEWRKARFLEYFDIPKDAVLPIAHGHEIFSCGVNLDNPKNKIKYAHPELEYQTRMALIYFNQEFNLIDFGDDIHIKDPKKHFSCKFYFPQHERSEALMSEDTNISKLFKEYSYRIPYENIANIGKLAPITHERFNTFLILYNSLAYLMVEDRWYPMFMYADLVLAQRHTKHNHNLECESAAHSLAIIIKRKLLIHT